MFGPNWKLCTFKGVQLKAVYLEALLYHVIVYQLNIFFFWISLVFSQLLSTELGSELNLLLLKEQTICIKTAYFILAFLQKHISVYMHSFIIKYAHIDCSILKRYQSKGELK